MDLFKELLPSIMSGNEPVLEDEKEYNPWLVNKALSGHVDTILYANEMNINYSLDRQLQYDYLFHSVRKRKRPFQKWFKAEMNTPLAAIKEYFACSNQKARETISILTQNQIKEIIKKVESQHQKKI